MAMVLAPSISYTDSVCPVGHTIYLPDILDRGCTVESSKPNPLSGLPDNTYRRFVREYLTFGDGVPDPFSSQVPEESAEAAYVHRPKIVDEIETRASQIILGAAGMGKSTLCRRPKAEGGPTLHVLIDLHRSGTAEQKLAFMEGKVSPLSPARLCGSIFDIFWENTFHRTPTVHHSFYQDREWLELLHWFYQEFRPVHAYLFDDLLLNNWLNDTSVPRLFPPHIQSSELLSQLLRLITFKPPASFGVQPFYTHVMVSVDSLDEHSPQAAHCLIADLDALHSMRLDSLTFKLYTRQRELVEPMRCVQRGAVPVIEIEPWSEQELCALLRLRVCAARQNTGVDDPEAMLDQCSLDVLLNPFCRDRAWPRIEEFIVQAARGCPRHALSLARLAVAACAGCRQVSAYVSPPLGEPEIQALAGLYFGSCSSS